MRNVPQQSSAPKPPWRQLPDPKHKPGFPLFYWPKKSRTFPGPAWEIFQDLFVAHECLNATYWHHKFKGRGLQVRKKKISIWADQKNAWFLSIFYQDFTEGVGTLINLCSQACHKRQTKQNYTATSLQHTMQNNKLENWTVIWYDN